MAPLTTAEALTESIAATLDVQETPGQPLLESVLAHLTGTLVLLLLDNLEQIADANPLVDKLLFCRWIDGDGDHRRRALALPNGNRVSRSSFRSS